MLRLYMLCLCGMQLNSLYRNLSAEQTIYCCCHVEQRSIFYELRSSLYFRIKWVSFSDQFIYNGALVAEPPVGWSGSHGASPPEAERLKLNAF